MADFLADFMEDIVDIVDDSTEVAFNPPEANLPIPPISVEDYDIPLSSPGVPTEAETPSKQKGKRARGSEGTYEAATLEGDIHFKRPRLESCPNLATWFEKKVGDPSMSNSLVRDHLSECHRLKKDMLRWESTDENDLKSQIVLNMMEVFFFLISLVPLIVYIILLTALLLSGSTRGIMNG